METFRYWRMVLNRAGSEARDSLRENLTVSIVAFAAAVVLASALLGQALDLSVTVTTALIAALAACVFVVGSTAVHMFTIPATLDRERRGERDRAMAEAAELKKRSDHSMVKFLLGVHLSQARFLANESDFRAWERTAAMFIGQAFGHGEAALFKSAHGMTFYGDGSPASRLRIAVDARCRRLQELIQRATSLQIEPEYDGSEWGVGVDIDGEHPEMEQHFHLVWKGEPRVIESVREDAKPATESGN